VVLHYGGCYERLGGPANLDVRDSDTAPPGPLWSRCHSYFTIPYAYLTDSNLCDDLWTIQLVV